MDRVIIQYDLNGNDLMRWHSIQEASEHLNIKPQQIKFACTGRSMSCKGFLFRYEDDEYLDDVTRSISEVNEPKSEHVDWYFTDMFSYRTR